ncbi:hypothetical protein [Ectobacillus polymachus]|uniref:hypothetical protein n=1 Tax=Ectobacillus polymachus TaxID=1508806 RepID=UPI003A8484F1
MDNQLVVTIINGFESHLNSLAKSRAIQIVNEKKLRKQITALRRSLGESEADTGTERSGGTAWP